MPSNKPRIQALIREKYYKKLTIIAEEEERSISKIAGIIIENYIDQYEKENGPIEIEPNKKVIKFNKDEMKPFA